jgi:hypothetical protein
VTSLFRVRLAVLRDEFPISYQVGLVVLAVTTVYGDRLLFAISAALFVILLLTGNARPRPGVPVDDRQPGLQALVRDVAAAIGAPVPDRVWLTGAPVIAANAYGPGRTELRIGLPLVRCLPVLEVRALLGHELSLLSEPHPWTVVKAHALWKSNMDRASIGRRVPRGADAVAAFVADPERRADHAAEVAAGRVAAVRAVVDADVALNGHELFVAIGATPPQRWWYAWRTVIEDMDDGWCRYLAHGEAAEYYVSEALPSLTTLHPYLMTAADVPARVVLAPVAEVPVEPLTRSHQRRLVRRLLEIRPQHIVQWATFATAPERWWRRRAARDAADAHADVAIMLGRLPVDDAETAVALITRRSEILAIKLGHPVSAEDALTMSPAAVQFVESKLLEKGWRLDHPAVRGVLRDPGGRVVDVYTLTVDTIAALLGPSTVKGSVPTGR